jgi:hypothetical protein
VIPSQLQVLALVLAGYEVTWCEKFATYTQLHTRPRELKLAINNSAIHFLQELQKL